MSYTPTNWQTGDTITAEKLNKLENGVASSGGTNSGLVLDIVHDFNNAPVSGTGESYSDISRRAENGEFLFIRSGNDSGDDFEWLYLSSVNNNNVTFTSSDASFTLYESSCEFNLTNYSYTYDTTTKEYTFTSNN